MHLIRIIFPIIAISLLSACTNKAPSTKVESDEQKLTEAWNADVSVSYTPERKIDLGIKSTTGGHQTFSITELEDFFKNQKHKDLITIHILNIDWHPQEPPSKEEMQKLADFLKSKGYKRIMVIVAGGRFAQVLLDTDA